jgi:hypothetical protein
MNQVAELHSKAADGDWLFKLANHAQSCVMTFRHCDIKKNEEADSCVILLIVGIYSIKNLPTNSSQYTELHIYTTYTQTTQSVYELHITDITIQISSLKTMDRHVTFSLLFTQHKFTFLVRRQTHDCQRSAHGSQYFGQDASSGNGLTLK